MSERLQLFCIPYAGGMADLFQELGGLLSSRMDVELLEYAGHGTRKTEPFYDNFTELTEDLFRQCQKRRDPSRPFAVFGYSMGSVAAYELITRYFVGDEPCHIFLASHEAPDVEWDSRQYERLDDESFMEELIAFGGFRQEDRRLLKNRFFYKLYFRPIREDYRLLAGYRMGEKRLLTADTTIFYSPRDISPEQIHSWDRFAGENRRIEYMELGDNHFFIRDHAGEIAQAILRECSF